MRFRGLSSVSQISWLGLGRSWNLDPGPLTPETTLSQQLVISHHRHHLTFERLTRPPRRGKSQLTARLACLSGSPGWNGIPLTHSLDLLTSPVPMKFINCFGKNHLTKCPKLRPAAILTTAHRGDLDKCPCFKEDWERNTMCGFWLFQFICGNLSNSLRICFDLRRI